MKIARTLLASDTPVDISWTNCIQVIFYANGYIQPGRTTSTLTETMSRY